MNLTEQQPETLAKHNRSFKERNVTGSEDVQAAGIVFLQYLCDAKFRSLETNFYQGLRKLSQDGNAIDHRLLLINENKIVA